MLWTQEETELIAVLEDFLANCSRSEKLKNSSHHRLVEQIVALTKGDLNATKKYCQQVLNDAKIIPEQHQHREESLVETNSIIGESIDSVISQPKSLPQALIPRTQKFQPFWTLLFLIFSTVTIFFAAQKLPKTASADRVANLALQCPQSLLDTARVGIINRDRILLERAIADLETLKNTESDRFGGECQTMLWETQFVYAIDFLASQGQQKQAVENLCNISAEYYRDREVIPWFTRWSNINPEFDRWLTQYKLNNNCAIANYLE